MRSLRRAGLALALGSVLAVNAAPAFAADNGTVDANVTVATPCILINSATYIDFGTLPFSSGNVQGTGQSAVNYQNCGAVSERIWAAGTDATGPGATWQLGSWSTGNVCDQPSDTYRIDLNGSNGSAAYGTLGTTPVQLETLDAPFASQVGITLTMPCVGSSGAGQTMSFQILLSASF